MEIKINGVNYWQPECYCKGTGHICYPRPMPQIIDMPIEKFLAIIDAQPQLEASGGLANGGN